MARFINTIRRPFISNIIIPQRMPISPLYRVLPTSPIPPRQHRHFLGIQQYRTFHAFLQFRHPFRAVLFTLFTPPLDKSPYNITTLLVFTFNRSQQPTAYPQLTRPHHYHPHPQFKILRQSSLKSGGLPNQLIQYFQFPFNKQFNPILIHRPRIHLICSDIPGLCHNSQALETFQRYHQSRDITIRTQLMHNFPRYSRHLLHFKITRRHDNRHINSQHIQNIRRRKSRHFISFYQYSHYKANNYSANRPLLGPFRLNN